ncbi:OLC1v1025670C1 [Oldenlandia corymbosa var. corymbosa]|uniref:OLC1v1025670C1 n=1 Tax=Oldenlandia corymbosa var. corymbosa TaxID=529605 RepID=A0AAV1C5F8_OLDCO|nr:OLC1v1025670C2 [Oldenlandia corymbosa var. corymbosa]CAI9090814.1 OLC1v1025670C1 [Oldenlandia corymbosa var. corymbosa]
MGTLYQSPPASSIVRDLKVTIQDTSVVFPAKKTEKRFMFLSNIDQVLNFYVQTVDFFPANPEFPPDVVAEKLKTALSKVLVSYDFMAGRLKLNQESGRLEIECNGQGVVYCVASSDYSLDDIGDLVYPNPAFGQLVVQKLDNVEAGDQPLCTVQLTSFKCGGFAVGISNNHCTFDGLSFKIFLQNLASQAFDDNKPLAITPANDRTLLAARNPPRVTFPHPELLKLKIPIGEEDQNLPVFDCPEEELDLKIFKLSSDDVNSLREKAKPDPVSTGDNNIKITSFNVVTSHIWRCKALSFGGDDPDRLSTVLYAVDIRSRLNPPLPGSYTGNAVLTAYATATCKELEDGPLSKVVALVAEGANRMTDEYARSAIDWGEVYKGFPHGEFLISSWWRLGFSDVVYPWGKPRYSCPVVHHRKDIILLFPDIDEEKNAVNVLVALPMKEMEKFQTLFHKLLKEVDHWH